MSVSEFLIFIATGTLLAVILGTIETYLSRRGERPKARRGQPEQARPDPEAAWAAINAECRRRIRASEKQRRVEQILHAFLDEIATYRSATGEDPGPARQYLAEIIARALSAKQTPTVRAVLIHARDMLSGGT
jgi:hypothetical protein